MRRWLSTLICAIICVSVQSVVAQSPKLRLETIAPASTVRKIVFSTDGKRLYSAGKDKVVRTWEIDRKNGRFKLILGHKFRWEISRGSRGHIYDVEVSPQGLVAFAGYSAWTNVSDVAVYDLKSRKLVKKLFTDPLKASAVADLAFSPAGKSLAAMTGNGELRVWDVKTWRENRLQKPAGPVQKFRSLCFRNETELISTETRGEDQIELVLRDISKNTARPQGNPHFPVLKLERFGNESKSVVAGYRQGHLMLCNDEMKLELLRKNAISSERTAMTAMTMVGDRYVALAMTEETDYRGASIEYWDVKSKKRLEKTTISKTDLIHTIAASPNGELVAYSTGESDEIRLINLVEHSKKTRIEQPFSQPPVAQVTGGLVEMFRVACNPAEGSDEVGIATVQRDNLKIDLLFDPSLSKVQDADLAREQWRTEDSDAGSFSVLFKIENSVAEVRKDNQLLGTIKLDRAFQGPATSHCWIAGKGKEPDALAIGTDNQNGIFIYDLRSKQAGGFPLLRYMRDHEAAVISMATLSDRDVLVSVSEDQTCKFWSLEGLFDTTPEFAGYPAWGAVLVASNDQTVEVKQALKSGIATARKLKNGTRIISVRGVHTGTAYHAKTAAEMIAAINRNQLWQGLTVYYKDKGEQEVKVVYITPAWEPMLTSVYSRNNQWAAWTPYGYYNSSPLGDEMFGWQMNPATQIEGVPKFFRSDQFRSDFEKPSAIERLLKLGNIEDALTSVAAESEKTVVPEKSDSPQIATVEKDPVKDQKDPKKVGPDLVKKPLKVKPERSEEKVAEMVPEKVVEKVAVAPSPIHRILANMAPGLNIISPKNSEEVVGKRLLLAVQIVIPKTDDLKNYKIAGYLNRASLGDPQQTVSQTQQGTQVICNWSVKNTEDNLNEFIVSATSSSKTSRRYFDRITFNSIAPRPRDHLPRLFMIGIAAGSYRGDLNLRFPVKDVEAVLNLLPNSAAKHYQFARKKFFLNQQIDREDFALDISEVMAEIKSVAKPEDLLFVYIAGHGATRNGQYYFVPPHPLLNSRATLNEQCDQYGVPWEEMVQLTEGGCKTIFMLDTCFAGDVLAAAKSRIRPLVDQQAIVISSSSAGRLSYESGDPLNHGVFAYCMLQALNMKADKDADGVVDLDEIIQYVRIRSAS